MNSKVILSILLFILLFSCRSGKEIIDYTDQKKLNEKEAIEFLFSKMNLNFECFYAKIGIDYTDANRSNQFSATVKMKIDSAFSGTMSVGPVIGATYLVSQDSIFFTDKMKSCYYMENLEFLTYVFGVRVEYNFFQSLILGLPIGLDEEIKYNYDRSREYYMLSSFKKKDLKKIDSNEEENIFVQYYINTETLHLDKIAIQVPTDTVTIDIEYLNRIDQEGFNLPENTKIRVVHPRDSILIDLKYNNVKINDCKDIGINIPERYVRCGENID